MASNVVHLPSPSTLRDSPRPIGLYFRVGRDQHKDVLDLLAEGEGGFHGLVIDAACSTRHRELRREASRRGLDVILDPKTQQMATDGGHTDTLAQLPWALEHPHRLGDFSGTRGVERVEVIAQWTVDQGYTGVLGPTHLLQSANDPWLREDIVAMGMLRTALDVLSQDTLLFYPLAIPMQVLRDQEQRRAIISAIVDAPFDAIWLKVENFGSDASGDKTAAYIDACAEFRELGLTVIADHVGGLPGLGMLAFGAVGGLAHGITMLEGFKANHWRRPRSNGGIKGSPGTRVYLQGLDILAKRHIAEAFLTSSPRVRSQFVCRDTLCCRHGLRDMLEHRTRHFVIQRSRQVAAIGGTPASVRVEHYLDEYVRPISDNIAAASAFSSVDETFRKSLSKRQRTISRFRQAMIHVARVTDSGAIAEPPQTRAAREAEGRLRR